VSDEIDKEYGEILDSLSETGVDGLAQVVQKLVDYYVENYDLDVAVAQNQMLIALSTVTGELIACMPNEDNIRDFVEQKVTENIKFTRTAVELDHAASAPSEDDPNGLAGMTPLGNC
jgi:hypothetical protein